MKDFEQSQTNVTALRKRYPVLNSFIQSAADITAPRYKRSMAVGMVAGYANRLLHTREISDQEHSDLMDALGGMILMIGATE